jgi:hypothetical protein
MRQLAILLLNDPNGISEAAYFQLLNVMEICDCYTEDIMMNIKGVEGRIYLHENHKIHP